MNETLRAPSRSHVMREAHGLIDLPRLLLRFPSLARQPRGNGDLVLVLPGYGAGDRSTMILKGYLRLLGYRAGLGLMSKLRLSQRFAAATFASVREFIPTEQTKDRHH